MIFSKKVINVIIVVYFCNLIILNNVFIIIKMLYKMLSMVVENFIMDIKWIGV